MIRHANPRKKEPPNVREISASEQQRTFDIFNYACGDQTGYEVATYSAFSRGVGGECW